MRTPACSLLVTSRGAVPFMTPDIVAVLPAGTGCAGRASMGAKLDLPQLCGPAGVSYRQRVDAAKRAKVAAAAAEAGGACGGGLVVRALVQQRRQR